MRTKLGCVRDAFLLWLAGMVSPMHTLYVLYELLRPQPFADWQGATPGWSPKRAVALAGGTAAWDVKGWQDSAETELHRALDEVERKLHASLIALREEAYAWRDTGSWMLARS